MIVAVVAILSCIESMKSIAVKYSTGTLEGCIMDLEEIANDVVGFVVSRMCDNGWRMRKCRNLRLLQ